MVIDTYVYNRMDTEAIPHFISVVLKNISEDNLECANILGEILSSVFKTQDEITVSIEDGYVDKIYRDCYYSHFSGKHFEYSRYCKRVLLFAGDCFDLIKKHSESYLQEFFIGSFVVRPLKVGTIGRTLINPKYMFDHYTAKNIYIRTSKFYVHFWGMRLYVNAFPYSMQDSETLTCAESTLLNIFDYYSNQYSGYRFMLPSEMFNIAIRNGYERILPSHGMSYKLISKIMVEFGFCPRLYMKETMGQDEELIRILSYYVESAIPVAIGIRTSDHYNHSITCVGHGKNNVDNMMKKLYRISDSDTDETQPEVTRVLYVADSANSIDEFVVMDDNLKPYSLYSTTEGSADLLSNKEIKLHNSQVLCLAVPLYKRMYLEASDARAICIELLKDRNIRLEEQYNNSNSKNWGNQENPIIMRLFLASSSSLKRKRIMAFDENDFCNKIYSIIPLPQFVWVCELYDKVNYNNFKPLGEIVLDATSTSNTRPVDSVIMINCFGKYLMRDRDGKSGRLIEQLFRGLETNVDIEQFHGYEFIEFNTKQDNFMMYKNNLSNISEL